MNRPLADFVNVFKIGRKCKSQRQPNKKRDPTSNIYIKCSLQNEAHSAKHAKRRHLALNTMFL